MEPTVKVLVVDDHEQTRRQLAALIEAQPDMEVVGKAANGSEAIGMAQATLPDVVIMDVVMPVLDGIRAASAIRALDKAPLVIMLSMHHSAMLVDQARRNGASGYLQKHLVAFELVSAIRLVFQGQHVF